MSTHPYPNDSANYGGAQYSPPYPGHYPHQLPLQSPPPYPQPSYEADGKDPASPYRSSYPAPGPPAFQNLYSSHSGTRSSSFESQGSSSNGPSYGGAPMPYVGFPPYSHGHMSPPPRYYYHWNPPVEYIKSSEVRPQDVLSGRGGATNTHSGNRVFRSLVKKFQPHYLSAKKRDKPSVAAEVVALVRKQGGRFLRKIEGPNQVKASETIFYDIGDNRATEKACQALREGAPKMKAKRGQSSSASFSSDDDNKYTVSDESSSPHKRKEERINASSSSSFERTLDEKENEAGEQGVANKHQCKNELKDESDGAEKLRIQPSTRLVRGAKVAPISVDDLPKEEREVYLREFLPPYPAIPANKTKPDTDPKPETHKSDDSPPIVSV